MVNPRRAERRAVVGAGTRGRVPGVGGAGRRFHGEVVQGVAMEHEQYSLPAGAVGEAGGGGAVREG